MRAREWELTTKAWSCSQVKVAQGPHWPAQAPPSELQHLAFSEQLSEFKDRLCGFAKSNTTHYVILKHGSLNPLA